MGFVDRSREMKLLEEAHRRGGSLVIVYGRRRIGKTRLLTEWSRGKPSVYYLAGPWSHSQNLREFAESIAEQLGLSVFKDARFTSLDAILRTLAEIRVWEKGLSVIIDEFTYWLQGDPRVAVELQRFVDLHLPHSNLTIVISGSIQGIMEKGVIGPRAPLFGRARYRIKLGPLPPWCLPKFAPNYSETQLVELHALVGGVPFYLENMPLDKHPPLEAYLRAFGPGSPLEDEALMIYREEFRDPTPYASLIKTLAQRGPTSLGKAAELSGMPTSHASKYLFTLQALGIVEPVPLWGSKRRLYRLSDNLLSSWYSIIEPHIHSLRYGTVPKSIGEAFNKHVSREWEQLAKEHAVKIIASQLRTTPARWGKLVKKQGEIDWVISDSDENLVVPIEAKWSTLEHSEAAAELRRLEKKAAALLPEEHEIHPLLYLRECKGCEEPLLEHVITAKDLPWGECE